MCADFAAVSATNALHCRAVHDLRTTFLPLGIVAPKASERASFQEDSGSDAWAVMKAELPYVKNYALRVSH